MASVAFYTIIQQRKEKHLLNSPIFTITQCNISLSRVNHSVDKIKLTFKNVGHGPAFNLSIMCAQGSSRFDATILSDGYTLEGKPSSAYTLNHVGEREISNWSFNIIYNEKQENNASFPIFIYVQAINLFGDIIEQFFSISRSTGAKTLYGSEPPTYYFWHIKLKNRNLFFK